MSKDNLPDDLQAVKVVSDALEPFDAQKRAMIIRIAQERLGMTPAEAYQQIASQAVATSSMPTLGTDIKSFVNSKSPKSDNQFCAAVAYYYRFEAPAESRKDTIGSDDIMDAARKVPWERFKVPAQTLNNAYNTGLLDKVGGGQYRLNTVGENLVAMVLPGGATKEVARSSPKRKTSKGKRGKK